MSVEGVVRSYARRLAEKNMKGVFDLFDDNAVFVEPMSAGGKPTTHRGKNAVRDFFEAAVKAAPNLSVSFSKDMISAGDVVSIRFSISGPAPVPIEGVDEFKIQNGKIVSLVQK